MAIKMTQRDQNLAVILPSMLVILVYGMFFFRDKVADCKRAAKGLADAEAKAPGAEQIAGQQRLLFMANQELHAAQTKLEEMQRQWRYATCFCGTGSLRNERVRKLTNLLNKNGLQPMEDDEADGGAKDTKSSSCADSLAKTITRLAPAQKPQLRRIRFNGRYAEVLQVLQELANGDVLAVPVGLTMKTTPDPVRREWTLLVWI
jgi:hypothetical protein